MNSKSPYIQNSIREQKAPSAWQVLLGAVMVVALGAATTGILYCLAFVIAAGAAAGWS